MRDLTDESLTEQLSRERLLDMEARLGHVRSQAFGVLALALIAAGPWIGFEFLIVLCRRARGLRVRRSLHAPQPPPGAVGRLRLGGGAADDRG